ncbi:hypothetical protein C1H46_003041 [Malus baccata]|uniref:Uncharacterized protein n=1 Tax=Malus baccata TaxID=106549 RepID=A0A540NJS0_MALBA|nr:hypothetical protein C1H46_003041 [Malus baccata]
MSNVFTPPIQSNPSEVLQSDNSLAYGSVGKPEYNQGANGQALVGCVEGDGEDTIIIPIPHRTCGHFHQGKVMQGYAYVLIHPGIPSIRFNWESSKKGGWYNILKQSVQDLASSGITSTIDHLHK